MSRREGRDPDSKRHRSGFDADASPKRSRRDGKPETERVPNDTNLDAGAHADRDQKHRRRLQDALPLEGTPAPDSKGGMSKESDRKLNRQRDGNKHSSDPVEVPRSQSYFQHDERGNAGQVGRSYGRKASERGWWKDARDPHTERAVGRAATHDERDEKSQAKRDENSIWCHDKFSEVKADPPPPARKRPAFREKKLPVDSDNAGKEVAEPEKQSHPDRLSSGSERREDRGHELRHLDRHWRPPAREWRESQRGGFSSREGFGSSGGGPRGGNYRGRDRFSGRQGYNSSGTQHDRWAHDLFDEANKSPPRKNEEEQIAKVESLLAS